jgi:hypothetical protein
MILKILIIQSLSFLHLQSSRLWILIPIAQRCLRILILKSAVDLQLATLYQLDVVEHIAVKQRLRPLLWLFKLTRLLNTVTMKPFVSLAKMP